MNKVEELLKNYLSYRHAVLVYERHKPVAAAGIANYSAMPSGSGAPERFFDLVGKQADMGHTSYQDHQDYVAYKMAVVEIEGALETLTEEQMSVIKLKWMQDISLKQIAVRKHCHEVTIKKLHRIAINRLNKALRFTDMPEIHVMEHAIVGIF